MSILDRFRLDGHKLLIVGGSRGLGREMALAIAGAGANVVLIGRQREELDKTATAIEDLGRKVWAVKGDVSEPRECEQLCQSVADAHPDIDILINNVGGRRHNTTIEDTPLYQWREIVDLNLTTTFLATRIVGGAMVRRGHGGRIINMASISGLIANRDIGGRAYEATKAAVIQFTKATAADWAPHDMTVNAICPGGFMTGPNRRWAAEHPEVIETFKSQIPMGEFGRPEDIGPLAVFLAGDGSRYMTGATIVIDGGYTLW